MKSLILFALLIGLFVAGKILEARSYSYGHVGIFLLVPVGFTLLLLILFVPINRLVEKSNIITYYSFKEMVEEMNTDNLEHVEKAMLRENIIETNNWLARQKYFNNTVFDWFIPDEILQLEPLVYQLK